MYVLYTDESGKARDPGDDVIVVAGIGVHEDAVHPLAGQANAILKRYVGHEEAARLEIHGSPMRSARGGWRRIDRSRRTAVADALLALVVNWTHAGSGTTVVPLGVVVDRARSATPVDVGYAELLHSFDQRLRSQRRGGEGHNCILVADKGRHEARLTAWVGAARAHPHRLSVDRRRLHALVETPFFVDSRSTRLMQLADLVSYSLYRAYNVGDWAWAEQLLPSIRAGRGSLMHMTARAGCTCEACASDPSRRTASPPS